MAGRLSKAEIFYIKNSGLSGEELAKELGRSLTAIYKHLPVDRTPKEEVKVEESAATTVPEPKMIPKGQVDKLLGKIKHPHGGDKPIGVVMTPAAAEVSDEFRKQSKKKLDATHIHTIKKKKAE